MSNANEPAYPGEETVFGEGIGGQRGRVFSSAVKRTGLTKREYFAAMAMQGLLAGEYRDTSDEQLQWVSEWAVKHADALLSELERTK